MFIGFGEFFCHALGSNNVNFGGGNSHFPGESGEKGEHVIFDDCCTFSLDFLGPQETEIGKLVENLMS